MAVSYRKRLSISSFGGNDPLCYMADSRSFFLLSLIVYYRATGKYVLVIWCPAMALLGGLFLQGLLDLFIGDLADQIRERNIVRGLIQ